VGGEHGVVDRLEVVAGHGVALAAHGGGEVLDELALAAQGVEERVEERGRGRRAGRAAGRAARGAAAR
jgi:hypothetical protein